MIIQTIKKIVEGNYLIQFHRTICLVILLSLKICHRPCGALLRYFYILFGDGEMFANLCFNGSVIVAFKLLYKY
jgi:hypothetical protein